MAPKVTVKIILIIVALLESFPFGESSGNALVGESYRLCVPSGLEGLCEEMTTTRIAGKIKCISASGKIGCIEKVIKDEADFLPLEPEEIFVAHKYQRNGLNVIAEIRSIEFASRDYRYEPVAIVRKSSGITKISDLRGKKSCHTGYGRNAGWKVPFSHLMDKNELPGLCNEIDASTPERDLYAMSKYFGKACAPGPWVEEKEADVNLRSKYFNLCELCKSPRDCDSKDVYSGYEGALKCLTENNGDVAWTKMDAVQRFFRLNSTTPSAIVGSFAFLCWDGSSQPLTSPNPCSWAKRPWRAFLATRRLTYEAIADLQKEISSYVSQAKQLRETNTSVNWDIKVLEVNATSETEVPYLPHLAKSTSAYSYLQQKNYTVTIEKPSCSVAKLVRICVKDVLEKLKCEELQLGAIGKRIVPGFDCVLGESLWDCFKKVQNGQADAVISTAKDAAVGKAEYGLVPIVSTLELIDEASQEKAPYKFAVAVIRNDSAIRNITDLKGKKSCHGSIRSFAGWNIPLNHLRNAGLISGPTCGLPLEMAKLFNGSCVPGLFDAKRKMPWLPDSLCSICAGDTVEGDPATITPGTLCQDGPQERFFGPRGALLCLTENVADVAFIDHVALLKLVSEGVITLNEVKLLCPQGQTMEPTQFRHCNWGKAPSRKILSRDGDPSKVLREDAKFSLLKAGATFSPDWASNVVPLFGPYYSNRDVLFLDTSVGLANNVQDLKSEEIINAFDFCKTSAARINSAGFAFLLTAFLLFSHILNISNA